MFLNVDLTKSYKFQLKRAVIKRLSFHLAHDLLIRLEQHASTPLLSFLFYNQGKYSESEVATLLNADILSQKQITGEDPLFRVMHETSRIMDPSIDTLSLFNNARTHINQVWPELGQIIEAIIERISYPPMSEIYESASDPKIFGRIQYTMDSTSVLKWAEILAHETAHHYMFVITAKNKYVEAYDWKMEARSAIREEQRPLIGILHGVVAEAFILQLLAKSESTQIVSEPYFKKAKRRFSRLLLSDFTELTKFDVTMPSPEIEVLIHDSLNFAKVDEL